MVQPFSVVVSIWWFSCKCKFAYPRKQRLVEGEAPRVAKRWNMAANWV
jgi:hypothetical protein